MKFNSTEYREYDIVCVFYKVMFIVALMSVAKDKLDVRGLYSHRARTNIYICSRAGMPTRPDEGIRGGATGDHEDPLRAGGEPVGSIVHLEIQ